jgi:hypothetical protein
MCVETGGQTDKYDEAKIVFYLQLHLINDRFGSES